MNEWKGRGKGEGKKHRNLTGKQANISKIKWFSLNFCAHAQSCPTLKRHPRDYSPPALSMGFSKQEYWSGLPCPPPGGLPNPGIKPASPVSPALPLGHRRNASLIETWLLFTRSVMSDSLQPHGPQNARLPCPSPSPGVCSNLVDFKIVLLWNSLLWSQ